MDDSFSSGRKAFSANGTEAAGMVAGRVGEAKGSGGGGDDKVTR